MPKYAYKTLTYFKEGIEALFNLASPYGDHSFYIKFMLVLDEVTYLNTELIQIELSLLCQMCFPVEEWTVQLKQAVTEHSVRCQVFNVLRENSLH